MLDGDFCENFSQIKASRNHFKCVLVTLEYLFGSNSFIFLSFNTWKITLEIKNMIVHNLLQMDKVYVS